MIKRCELAASSSRSVIVTFALAGGGSLPEVVFGLGLPGEPASFYIVDDQGSALLFLVHTFIVLSLVIVAAEVVVLDAVTEHLAEPGCGLVTRYLACQRRKLRWQPFAIPATRSRGQPVLPYSASTGFRPSRGCGSFR